MESYRDDRTRNTAHANTTQHSSTLQCVFVLVRQPPYDAWAGAVEMSRGCWRAAGGRGFCAGWGRGVSFQILRGCRFVLCVVLFRWRKAGEKLEKARVKLEKAFFVFVSLCFCFLFLFLFILCLFFLFILLSFLFFFFFRSSLNILNN